MGLQLSIDAPSGGEWLTLGGDRSRRCRGRTDPGAARLSLVARRRNDGPNMKLDARDDHKNRYAWPSLAAAALRRLAAVTAETLRSSSNGRSSSRRARARNRAQDLLLGLDTEERRRFARRRRRCRRESSCRSSDSSPEAARHPWSSPSSTESGSKIGGYVVPLDFEATSIKEFLLVPFVGACIHVPPPPANQIIYVKAADGFDVSGSFDPVTVTGTIKTETAFTGLADAGYSITAEAVEVIKP